MGGRKTPSEELSFIAQDVVCNNTMYRAEPLCTRMRKARADHRTPVISFNFTKNPRFRSEERPQWTGTD